MGLQIVGESRPASSWEGEPLGAHIQKVHLKGYEMPKWAKVALIAGLIHIVLTTPTYLVNLLPQGVAPLISAWTCIIFVTLYPALGGWTVSQFPPPWNIPTIAKHSALAGLFASSVFTICASVLQAIYVSTGGLERYLQNLPPESTELLQQTGIVWLYTARGQVITMLCSGTLTITLAVLLSTLAGIVYATIRNE